MRYRRSVRRPHRAALPNAGRRTSSGRRVLFTPNTSRKTGWGKRHAPRPPVAVATPETGVSILWTMPTRVLQLLAPSSKRRMAGGAAQLGRYTDQLCHPIEDRMTVATADRGHGFANLAGARLSLDASRRNCQK